MIEKIAGRTCELLETAGYTLADGDEAIIRICAAHTRQEIMNGCNITDVPEGLLICASRLTAAEFLKLKKATGALEGFAGIDLTAAVNSIQEGDTAVSYDTAGTASTEQRLDAWISALESCRRQLIAYRRLIW